MTQLALPEDGTLDTAELTVRQAEVIGVECAVNVELEVLEVEMEAEELLTQEEAPAEVGMI